MKDKMYKHKLLTIAGITLAAVFCCCGCNDHAKKKQAMIRHWDENTSTNNIKTVQAMLENGNVDQAIKTLEECIAKSPGLVQAHILMGKAHFMQSDLEKAGKSFAVAVDLDGELDEGWYWLGETQTRQGLYKSAVGCYNYAIQLNPAAADYVISAANAHALMGNYDKAIELFAQKQKVFTGDISIVMAHADILMRSGKKEEAIKIYHSGLLFNSESPKLLEALGYCYMLDKKWEEAAKMFEILLVDAPDSQKQIYLDILSTCSMNTGDYARAMGYLDRIKSDSREDAHLWLKTGQAALGANQPKRAISYAQRALFLKSGWADAKILLGSGQYMNQDYTNAIRTFSELIYNDNTANFAWMMTGKCYQQLGNQEKALKAFGNVEVADAPERMVRLLKEVADR